MDPDRTSDVRETILTDRDILLHILQHVEDLWETIEQFRPLLDALRGGNGQVDAVAAAGIRRAFRRPR